MDPSIEKQVSGQMAATSKALANPNRIEMIEHLAQKPYSVEELASACQINLANASQHLQVLKNANLVSSVPQGQRIIYRLKDKSVYELISAVRRFCLQYNHEILDIKRNLLQTADSSKPLNIGKLLKRLGKKSSLVVDARTPAEFAAEHIEGAVSIHDQAQLDNVVAKFTVVYGRHVLCPLAYTGAARLRAQGFEVRRLDSGYAEWKAAGLPVWVSG